MTKQLLVTPALQPRKGWRALQVPTEGGGEFRASTSLCGKGSYEEFYEIIFILKNSYEIFFTF